MRRDQLIVNSGGGRCPAPHWTLLLPLDPSETPVTSCSAFPARVMLTGYGPMQEVPRVVERGAQRARLDEGEAPNG